MNALHFQERQIGYEFSKAHKCEFPVEKICMYIKVSENAFILGQKQTIRKFEKNP